MTHPLNTRTSTVGITDLIPLATLAVQRFIKGKSETRVLRHFGSQYTLDDLVMEAVEKVIRADPEYLTKSYINLAAKCVCIDRLQQKKLPWQESVVTHTDEEDIDTSLEELLVGDTYDHMSDLEEYIRSFLSEEELAVFNALTSRQLYAEMAEDLGVSIRTLERRVHDLKWKLHYIINEEEPK